MASSIDHDARTDDENYELLSLHLSRVLDILGCSQQMVNYRIQAYQERDRQQNTDTTDRIITAGSKGEGLTRPTEGDIDILHIPKNVVCVEEDSVYKFQDESSSVVSFNPNYKHPGYSLLTICHLARDRPVPLSSSIMPLHNGRQVVSSDSFVKCYERHQRQTTTGFECRGQVGPAVNLVLGKFEFDQVASLRSFNTTVLSQWLVRPRRYDWPSVKLRSKVAMMEGNFVAKGCKQSRDGKHEWRQCFNEIELILMHSFNETKTKLYSLMKIILKGILRPLDKTSTITSYVMKNIVFWMSEDNPTEAFQPQYLMRWVIKGLQILKISLKEMYLPYYMIPARNLLADSMLQESRDNLVACLNRLIREGPMLLVRCEKLAFTREMTYSEICDFGERRDELEMLQISTANCMASTPPHDLSDERKLQNDPMYKRMGELAYSSWPPHIQYDLNECNGVVERVEVILS